MKWSLLLLCFYYLTKIWRLGGVILETYFSDQRTEGIQEIL